MKMWKIAYEVVPAAATGILLVVGSTTTVVALPVTGVVAAASLIGYGIFKGFQACQEDDSIEVN
jgi:hypothetical protein